MSLTDMTIPHSVTNLGEEVFQDCVNLESVLIGDSARTLDVRQAARRVTLADGGTGLLVPEA